MNAKFSESAFQGGEDVNEQLRSRTYAGVPIVTRISDRRRRILESASTLFTTKGYAATSVQDVCSAARVARRDFYALYANREAVLIALLEQVMGGALKALQGLLPTAEQIGSLDDPAVVAAINPSDRIASGVRRLLVYYHDDCRRARIKCVESIGVSTAVEDVRHDLQGQFIGYLTGVFRLLVAANLAQSRPFTVTATALMGAFDATIAVLAHPNSAADFEDVVAQMTHLVFSALELT